MCSPGTKLGCIFAKRNTPPLVVEKSLPGSDTVGSKRKAVRYLRNIGLRREREDANEESFVRLGRCLGLGCG